jgi:hypothetical protein
VFKRRKKRASETLKQIRRDKTAQKKWSAARGQYETRGGDAA